MTQSWSAGVVLALGLGWAGGAQAATALDEALKLMQRGEYIQALAELKPIANQGDAEAQYQLGQIYERGLGIVPDDYWAQHWYRQAAEQGHPAAAESLAGMGARLQGLATTTPAVREAEDPTLGVIEPLPAESLPPADLEAVASPEPTPEEATVPTDGVKRNDLGLPDVVRPAPPKVDRYGYQLPGAKTVQLAVGPGEQAALNLAASRGLRVHFDPNAPIPAPRGDDVPALPTGDGPSADPAPPSFVAAPATANASSDLGAKVALAPSNAAQDPPAPSPATLPALPAADAGEDLSTLDGPALKAAAESGKPAAQRELALRLHQGRGEPRDLKQALVWYQKAAEQGDAAAQFHLGNLYLMGEGVGRDDAWAITWFRRAAAQGHGAAQSNLDNLLRLEVSKP